MAQNEYTVKHEDSVICPNCGSPDTQKMKEDISMAAGMSRPRYFCSGCKKDFYPAFESNSKNIKSWSKHVRMTENNNMGQSWKDNDADVINEIVLVLTQTTGIKSDSSEYAKFVNGLRDSKFLTNFFKGKFS
jgi:transposase-like protein